MSAKQDTTLPLQPNEYYHVYNRGNRGQLIFYEEKHFDVFLKQYAKYMSDYWDTFAYALIPNHFHLLIRVKSGKALVSAAIKDEIQVSKSFINKFYPKDDIRLTSLKFLTDKEQFNKSNFQSFFGKGDYLEFCYQLIEWLAMERFRRFLLSYAKKINFERKLHGSLFQKHFKRKHLAYLSDWCQVAKYLHRNPIHHGMALTLEDYYWTSYASFFSGSSTLLHRKEVLSWFEGIENFQKYHTEYVEDWKNQERWCIED